jgi:hypothetical protein
MALATSLENANRPASTLRSTIASSPGSEMGMSPAFSRSILDASMSAQTTLAPVSAKHAPLTKPT